MYESGTIGYLIGKKIRLMEVKKDADLLWQILVREIYILMKHYKTKEGLQKAFESIRETTSRKPSREVIEKCKIFTNLETLENPFDWDTILYHCQNSYINMLESGFILNKKEENGLVFILDFNKGIVKYYNKEINGNQKHINSATIEEIMKFKDMPTNSLSLIVGNMKTRFTLFYEKLISIEKEIFTLTEFKQKQDDINIINKIDKLLGDKEWEKKQLHLNRRTFFHQLKAINVIEDNLEKG
jgi:hypothetical protein